MFQTPVLANTINVNLTIPGASSGGGGGSPPPVDNPPTIGNVNAVVTATSTVVTWTAADDFGVSSVNFSYGPSTLYGSSVSVFGSYTATLSNLNPASHYFYQIAVTDSGGHTTLYADSFTTAAAADTTAPNIHSLALQVGVNGATSTWVTTEPADSQLFFGLSPGYGTTLTDSSYTINHSFTLSGLTAYTDYHYKVIATDAAGNATSTNDLIFRTLPDLTPSADVNGLSLNASTTTLALTWNNPPDLDFTGVHVRRTVGQPATSSVDGVLVYAGNATSFVDTPASPTSIYFYTVYSLDSSGNYSGGAFVSGRLLNPPPTPEICNNGVDDDGNGFIDCSDASCAAVPECKILKNEICNNEIDDDRNGAIDCADSACTGQAACVVPPVVVAEICGNGVDDNGNGASDCADPACAGVCQTGGQVLPQLGGTTTTPNTTYVPPAVTVSTAQQLTPNQFDFYASARQIELPLVAGTVTSLSGSNFSVVLASSSLPATPRTMFVTLDGLENHLLVFDLQHNQYAADLVFPTLGSHKAYIEIDYTNGQHDSVKIDLWGLPSGKVLSQDKPLGDVVLTLYNDRNEPVQTAPYGLSNPQSSTENGTYGWVVPNGRYYVLARKNSFYTRKTPLFSVNNHVVNATIYLIPLPPPLDLNPEHLAQFVEVTAQLSLQKISDTLIEVQAAASNPAVQETVTKVVAPAVVGVVAVGTVSVVSWANLIPFLQLIFFQPLTLLGGRRRRAAWGQVYNSLNKLPVDLAAVRLVSAETGRTVQSKVTDSQGRYAFIAQPGNYRIEVIKGAYTFPSSLLAGARDDGQKVDIYHGETIRVSDSGAIITVNIPLDPAGEHEKPTRLVWQQAVRRLQIVISWFGLFVTVGALYLSPRWSMWLLLAVHVAFFGILRALATPAKVKGWGVVYDLTTKAPVGRAVARLFNVQFNKLVASQITDHRGRYYFLAGDNEYYVTYEHPDYASAKTQVINLKGHPTETISVDIGLRDKQSNVEAAPSALQKTPFFDRELK